MVCMLEVAAIALFLSTVTRSPLGAALGALAVLVASTILLGLEAASALQPYLPTRYWLAFVDLFRDPILWRDVLRGIALQAVYVVVFLAAGWANFMTKDVTDWRAPPGPRTPPRLARPARWCRAPPGSSRRPRGPGARPRG